MQMMLVSAFWVVSPDDTNCSLKGRRSRKGRAAAVARSIGAIIFSMARFRCCLFGRANLATCYYIVRPGNHTRLRAPASQIGCKRTRGVDGQRPSDCFTLERHVHYRPKYDRPEASNSSRGTCERRRA